MNDQDFQKSSKDACKTSREAAKTSKEASKTSREAQIPEQTSGQKKGKATSTSAVEKSTNKKTIVKSPAREDKRDELSLSDSIRTSRKRKLSLSLRNDLVEPEEDSMAVPEGRQRDGKAGSSSEEEEQIARRGSLQARTGGAFTSPSTSRKRDLLRLGLLVGGDTISDHKRNKSFDEAESTEDLQGSEDGEVVENTADKRVSKKKHKTARAGPEESGAHAPATESRAPLDPLGNQREVPASEEEEEDAEDDASADTVTLLKRYGRDGEDPSSSESDESEDSNDKPRRLRGPFKFTPQEVYDNLRGDEDPVEKGWNRKFLTTEVNTEMGKMSFVTALGLKRRVYQRALAQVRKDHKGENSYVPHLHITQNGGYKATMLTELSWGAFKKLQTEWGIAQALTPGQVDHTGLIPVSLHLELRIQIVAYCGTHLPDERPWLESIEDNSWKKWSPPTFFDRILRVFPHPTVERDSAIYTQLKTTPLVYDSADNYASVSKWFRLVNTILDSFEDNTIDQTEVLDILYRKLKSMGPGATNLCAKLKAQKPADFGNLWGEWEKQRRIIGLARSVITDYAPGPNHKNTFVDPKREKESARDRKLRKKEEKKRDKARHATSNDTKSRPTGSTNCRVCGKPHLGQCRLSNHPDANLTDKPWAESDMGKRWKAKGYDSLSGTQTLAGDPWRQPNRDNSFKKGPRKHGESWAQAMYEHMFAMQYVGDDEYTLPCRLHNEYVNSPLITRVLIDTGALQSNNVNLETAAYLQKAREQEDVANVEGEDSVVM